MNGMSCGCRHGLRGAAKKTGINAGIDCALYVRGYAVTYHDGLILFKVWDMIKTVLEKIKGWLFISHLFRYEHSFEKMEDTGVFKTLDLGGINSV